MSRPARPAAVMRFCDALESRLQPVRLSPGLERGAAAGRDLDVPRSAAARALLVWPVALEMLTRPPS